MSRAQVDEATLNSNAQPLLADNQDTSDLHEIVKKIEAAKNPTSESNQSDAATVVSIADSAEESSENTSSCPTIVPYLKTGTAYVMLGGRVLSCLYRFVLVNETVRLFFKMPGLNHWEESSGVMIAADVAGGVFALADMIQTVIASKKDVLSLCEHPSWLSGVTEFAQHVWQGVYPKDLLVSGMLVCFASGMKGVVGSQNVLHRLSQLPHMGQAEIINPLTYFVGTASSICFLAFQWLGQAMWVDRALKSFKTDNHYSNYLSHHKGWDRKISFIGWLMGISGALVGAISACYVNHQFEFKNPLHMALFFIAFMGAYFNLFYSYNPMYRIRKLQRLHDELESCPSCLFESTQNQHPQAEGAAVSTTNETPICEKVMGFFGSVTSGLASIGGSVTFSPAIIRTMQIILSLIGMAASDREKYESTSQNPYFIMGAFIFSAPFVYLSMLQYVAVWGKQSDLSKKSPAPNNRTITVFAAPPSASAVDADDESLATASIRTLAAL